MTCPTVSDARAPTANTRVRPRLNGGMTRATKPRRSRPRRRETTGMPATSSVRAPAICWPRATDQTGATQPGSTTAARTGIPNDASLRFNAPTLEPSAAVIVTNPPFPRTTNCSGVTLAPNDITKTASSPPTPASAPTRYAPKPSRDRLSSHAEKPPQAHAVLAKATDGRQRVEHEQANGRRSIRTGLPLDVPAGARHDRNSRSQPSSLKLMSEP